MAGLGYRHWDTLETLSGRKIMKPAEADPVITKDLIRLGYAKEIARGVVTATSLGYEVGMLLRLQGYVTYEVLKEIRAKHEKLKE